MESLINQLLSLQQKCKDYGGQIETITGRPSESDLRSGCFAMIFNSAILTLELLSFYYGIWKGSYTATAEEIRRLKKDNTERCIIITKMHFVHALSSIEFCMKETISLFPEHPLARWFQHQRRVYLSGIINKSKRLGLIDDKEQGFWKCLSEIRNVIVHNNGIADFDNTYEINEISVSFAKGKMMQGKLDFFIKLSDKAVDLYYSWVKNFS